MSHPTHVGGGFDVTKCNPSVPPCAKVPPTLFQPLDPCQAAQWCPCVVVCCLKFQGAHYQWFFIQPMGGMGSGHLPTPPQQRDSSLYGWILIWQSPPWHGLWEATGVQLSVRICYTHVGVCTFQEQSNGTTAVMRFVLGRKIWPGRVFGVGMGGLTAPDHTDIRLERLKGVTRWN